MSVQIDGSTGNIIAIKADYSGDVSIGGTLTYEDVTNIDAVGLITARSGVKFGESGTTVFGNSTGIGIGEASPTRKLVVAGDTNTVAVVRGATNGTSSLFLGDSDDEDIGALTYNHPSNYLAITVNASERARIDSSGRLLIGTTSARATKASASIPSFQIEGTGDSDSRMNIGRNSNADNGPEIHLYKTRGTSLGSNTVVQDDDFLGTIGFFGADGSDLFSRGAEITAAVDGTPGSDDMPTRLTFATCADGSASPTERMRIDSSGRVLIGTTSSFASGNADDLVIGDNTDSAQSGITLGSTVLSSLRFADAGNDSAGYISYLHSDDTMRFNTNNSEALRIDSSGRLGLGTISPGDYSGASTKFTVAASGDSGLNIVSGTSNTGIIRFADGTSGDAAYRGRIEYMHNGDALMFGTSGSERLRIDGSGRLLIGTTSAIDGNSTFETYNGSGHNHVRVQSDSLANGEYAMFRALGNTSGGGSRQAYLGVYKHAAIVNPGPFLFLEGEGGSNAYYWTDNSGNFRTSGSTAHIGTTSGTVVGTQTSDLRLKNVGANVSYGLAEIKQLQPKQYALKTNPDVDKLGFIAQEVESIIPEAVFDTNVELDGHQEGDRTKLGMEYVQLIPVLVNAIKELSAEVDTLKTKVAALEG